jgi:leucine dehydrogenase
MSVFSHPDFDHHEQVVFCNDPKTGLEAIVAVHNTNLGPALGGCRMWPYETDAEALTDVLRLSRGMSYKSAVAGLPLGGGKSVIIGDPRRDKSPQLMRAMGVAVERLSGRYIAAEDSGTGVTDMKAMGTQTRHVAGIAEKRNPDGTVRTGDPSPATAYGTFVGLKSAVRSRLGTDDLTGLRVAVQGVGNVGFRLAKHLVEAGARVWVSDIYPDQVDRAVRQSGATAVAPEAIFGLEVDVFAPCALGGAINDDSLEVLKASIVAGAANNQLQSPHHGRLLAERNVLYAPDYVINAGGIIDVYYERVGHDMAQVLAHVDGIGNTLDEIFSRARDEGRTTAELADQVAEERFLHGNPGPTVRYAEA